MVIMTDVTVALGVVLSLPADIRKHLKEFQGFQEQFKATKVKRNDLGFYGDE